MATREQVKTSFFEFSWDGGPEFRGRVGVAWMMKRKRDTPLLLPFRCK